MAQYGDQEIDPGQPTGDPLWDGIEPANPDEHPRNKVRPIRETKKKRWSMDKKAKPDPSSLQNTADQQTMANLTAMLDEIRTLSLQVAALQAEVAVAGQKAEEATGKATEAAKTTVINLLQGLPDTIDKALTAKTEEVGKQIVQAMRQNVPTVQPSPAPDSSTPNPTALAPQQANPLLTIFGGILQNEMNKGQPTAMGQAFQLVESMMRMTAAMQASVFEPHERQEDRIFKRALDTISTIAKTGAPLPWEHETKPKGNGVSEIADNLKL